MSRNKKSFLPGLAALVLIALAGIVLMGCLPAAELDNISAGEGNQDIIGGDKDEYGCLTPAGYSWDAEIGACIREWELDQEQKRAAGIAVAPMSYSLLTITRVEQNNCEGCYTVHISAGSGEQEVFIVILKNWEILEEDEINSFEDCVEAGFLVMESYPRQCSTPGGKHFVEETEEPVQDDKNYCTPEQKSAEMCTMEYMPVCGDDGKTYSNACVACSSGNIDYWTDGEC